MQPTSSDAARYLNQVFVETWTAAGFGELPICYVSQSGANTNISWVNESKRRMSPFITVNDKLVAKGTKPHMDQVDLQDGEQFYALISSLLTNLR